MLFSISVLEYEEHDQHDLDIEIVPQYYLDPDPSPIPNHKSKWDEKLIEAAGNVAGDLNDRRRTRSQYQNEHVALSHSFTTYIVVQQTSREMLLDDED